MVENRFTRIGEILPGVLKKIGLERKMKEREILSLWPEAVGDEVAARTKAVKLEKGELRVCVDHGAWMQELHFMEKEIIAKLREKVPGVDIRRIRFTTSRVESP